MRTVSSRLYFWINSQWQYQDLRFPWCSSGFQCQWEKETSPPEDICRNRSALLSSKRAQQAIPTITYIYLYKKKTTEVAAKNDLGSVVPPNCQERGATEKQIPADNTVYFLAQLETMQTDQTTDFWKYHPIKITVQMSHWCLWHKRKKKMHVLFTNHMYPSSVVSNVNVRRKHPSWCLYTKHKKYIQK